MGIVAESIQGDGHIHFEYSAYIPRGPHSGAHFYSNDTEFTLRIYISASGRVRPEPDLPAQVRRHVVPDVRRESGNGDDHDKCKSLTRMSEVRR